MFTRYCVEDLVSLGTSRASGERRFRPGLDLPDSNCRAASGSISLKRRSPSSGPYWSINCCDHSRCSDDNQTHRRAAVSDGISGDSKNVVISESSSCSITSRSQAIRSAQGEHEVDRTCTLAEAEETTTGLRDSALIRLMSDCLLRISEVVAIDLADVDNVLTIRRSKTDQEIDRARHYCTIQIREMTPSILQIHHDVLYCILTSVPEVIDCQI